MSEEQGEYNVQQEVEEAMHLIGMGRSDASYEIHMPAKVLRDGMEGTEEYTAGVWVKITAAFRYKHLKRLKGSKLGVWLCIALHIDEANNSHPSIETICKETGYSNREVIDCVRELEKDGYLTVIRGAERYNIYHVNFGAAFGRANPTCEESSQVNFTTKTSEVSSESLLKSSLKEEPVKKNQKKKKEADASVPKPPKANDFPSNVLFREVTEYYPVKANWHTVLKYIDGIARRLKRQPTKEDLFPFYEAWCGNGWNKLSINWLEYAERGELPRANGNGKHKPNLDDIFAQAREELRYE